MDVADGTVAIQRKYETAMRDLDDCRVQLSHANTQFQGASALAATLQRHLEDRTQELVTARGEIEALNTLAQKLHDVATAAPSGNEGALVCQFAVVVYRHDFVSLIWQARSVHREKLND